MSSLSSYRTFMLAASARGPGHCRQRQAGPTAQRLGGRRTRSPLPPHHPAIISASATSSNTVSLSPMPRAGPGGRGGQGYKRTRAEQLGLGSRAESLV